MKNQFNPANVIRQTGRFESALAYLLLGLPLGAGVATAAEQPQYKFTEIVLPTPAFAVGINDRGVATGFYTDPGTGDALSFVLDHGVLTTGISGPGDTFTALGPANNRDVESGNYGDFTDQQPVFYDIRTGTYTPLPEIPGMPINFCDGINDAGHASGVAYPGGNFDVGEGIGLNWIWDGGNYSYFTVPGSEVNGAVAGGINNRDQVTGYYLDNVTGLPHGFLKDGPNFTTFDAPGDLYTLAFGINNLGVVAGGYVEPTGGHHGYFWSKGEFVTVDVPLSASVVGTRWYGSNEHGDLAGNFFDAAHAPHAVIAERMDGK